MHAAALQQCRDEMTADHAARVDQIKSDWEARLQKLQLATEVEARQQQEEWTTRLESEQSRIRELQSRVDTLQSELEQQKTKHQEYTQSLECQLASAHANRDAATVEHERVASQLHTAQEALAAATASTQQAQSQRAAKEEEARQAQMLSLIHI